MKYILYCKKSADSFKCIMVLWRGKESTILNKRTKNSGKLKENKDVTAHFTQLLTLHIQYLNNYFSK